MDPKPSRLNIFTFREVGLLFRMKQVILLSFMMVFSSLAIGNTIASSTLQQREVTGTVVDKSGTPLPGVNVIVKGTAIGAVTNLEGKYSITVPSDAEILQFSFVGMAAQEAGHWQPDHYSTLNSRLKKHSASQKWLLWVTAFSAEVKSPDLFRL